MSRTLLTLFTLAALAASPISASAQAGGQTSIKVFYGDLDLSKAAGMQTLLRRIKQASYQVCDSHFSSRLRTDYQAHCARDAMAKALDAIDVPGMHNRVVAESNEKIDR